MTSLFIASKRYIQTLLLCLCAITCLSLSSCSETSVNSVIYYPNGGSAENSVVIVSSVSPNPSKGDFSVFLELRRTSDLTLCVYASDWHLMKELNEGIKNAGMYQYLLDFSDLPTGNYYLMTKASGYAFAMPFVIAK